MSLWTILTICHSCCKINKSIGIWPCPAVRIGYVGLASLGLSGIGPARRAVWPADIGEPELGTIQAVRDDRAVVLEHIVGRRRVVGEQPQHDAGGIVAEAPAVGEAVRWV